MRRIALIGLPVVALIALAAPNFADDKKADDKKAGDEMAKMMAEYAKIAAPCEFHKHLAPLAGKWTVAQKFKMSPDAPWQESKSESTSEWVLGGRFLVQKVKGDPMPGMGNMGPFEGMGMTGYDNAKKKYVATWADNMGTMIMVSEGKCDASGKEITFTSTMYDAMTKKDCNVRYVQKIVSDDKNTMEFYQPAPDGKEFLGMVLTYTRVKD